MSFKSEEMSGRQQEFYSESITTGSGNTMISEFNTSLENPFSDSLSANGLSVAVIGPDNTLRKAAISALAACHEGEVREFSSYPPGLDDLPKLLDQRHDIVMIEIDSNLEFALDMVEAICASGASTVMVYSKDANPDVTDPDLLMRCMRAGAREFLSMPFANDSMAEALVRAAARRPVARAPKKTGGRLLVFCGAKGGAGVTAIACSFASSLAQESNQSTLLIDLAVPMGDAALNFGIVADYSTIDALQNWNRLDSSFLSKLIVKHSSGLFVLAAPSSFSTYRPTTDALEKLLALGRKDFENVVVDAGSKFNFSQGIAPFNDASTIYLVTQAGIPELRNANRFITQYFNAESPKLEVVLNRYESRGPKISDDDIRKALTKAATWKIPNDYPVVRKMQDTATPVALTDSSIAWQIDQMARAACGLPEVPQKKKGFSLRSLGRSIPSKSATSTDSPSIFRLDSIIAPSVPTAEGRTLSDGDVDSDHSDEPQTRTYKGNKYVKGTDSKWELHEDLLGDPNEESPSVAWSTPDSIPYGTPLSSTQFNAAASVSGQFSYTPSEGYLLPVGTHTLWVTFRPDGAMRNAAAQASVVLNIIKATPIISWPPPNAMFCGTALGAEQLNATASVPGEFEYDPSEGEVPGVGIHSLLVAFTPTDTISCNMAQAEVSLTVIKTASIITWAEPPAISYGTTLGGAQLNAIASVPGTFTYSPHEGSLLAAGKHTISVEFSPSDPRKHTAARAEVSITITKAIPILTWPIPQPISYGTPLNAGALNATASVDGTFAYIPSEGAVLGAGKHRPFAIFTPADSANYASAKTAVSLTVMKATPLITWLTPNPIPYGAGLSASELNATASVPGTFVYSPSMGDTLTEGSHTLSVTFTPIDAMNFTTANGAVTLTIAKAVPPVITWVPSPPISYGRALSADQLNASASVPGKYEYSPAGGALLSSGSHTLLVKFTPTDGNLPVSQTRVELTVTKATPVIKWATPKAISYGIALSSVQLNATASAPGAFSYSPADGDVLAAGAQGLTATFTPSDSKNYTTVTADVLLTVTKVMPVISWEEPASISYGTPLGQSQLNASTSIEGRFIYAPASGTVLTAGAQPLAVTFIPADTKNFMMAQAGVSILVDEISGFAFLLPSEESAEGSKSLRPIQGNSVASAVQERAVEEKAEVRASSISGGTATGEYVSGSQIHSSGHVDATRGRSEPGIIPTLDKEPETRTYKGATYRKGMDGQWHLQQK